jgi:cation:H+ antiporter
MIPILLFIISFGILVFASRFVISSSIRISEYVRISELAVGYLIIATATTVPDLFVSVTASYDGFGQIALGDVLGSSIANICLVLGAATLIRRIKVRREQTLESAELLLIVTIIPLILITKSYIGFTEGAILVVVFFMYAFFAIKERFTMGLKEGVTHRDWIKQAIIFLLSISATLISARFMVHSGAELAVGLGINGALIGMTVIALGTTLPELAIEFTAIRKGHFALAIGDIFGSCVINLTLVLGLSAMINPLYTQVVFVNTAIAFLVGAAVFLWYILVKHEGIKREHGLIFIVAYILFLMLELMWGLSGTT